MNGLLFAVVNIPDDTPGGAAVAASVGDSPHKAFPRISSFTGSDGNRRSRRRKPFKSSSNHSLKATHPQMVTNHAQDPSGVHRTPGADSHDGSQHSYSTYAASHDAPVHGFHVQPAGGLHPHVNDNPLSSDSPRWGKLDGVYDDGASSAADSQQTTVTTSSTNTGVDSEQKRLIHSELEMRARV